MNKVLKNIYSMNDQQKLKQLERLDRVTDQEWREVRLALARRLAWRLKAVILTGEHGELVLVGGKTRKGAHSEANLSMPPLDYYVEKVMESLLACTRSWGEDVSLTDQCCAVLDSMLSHEVEKFVNKPEPPPADLDVDTLGEEDEPLTEEPERDWTFDGVLEKFKDEPELARFIEAIDMFDTTRERCAWLGIDGRQYENLRKKVNRRLINIIQK